MKIHSPYPEPVNKAIIDNMPLAEFTQNKAEADVILPVLPLPIRLSELLNHIESGSSRLNIATLQLDKTKNILSEGKISLDLTEKETALLHYLATRQNVTRDALAKDVWGHAYDVDTNTIESHIYRLRQKILATFNREIIITDGSNYKLVEK